MTENEISDQNQLYLALGYCAFMLILALVLKKWTPKKRNHLYGYRTTRSMKNQRLWKAANDYAAAIFVRICLYSFLIPMVCYFISPQYNLLSTIIVNTVLLFYILYATEKYLNSHFDVDGNPLP